MRFLFVCAGLESSSSRTYDPLHFRLYRYPNQFKCRQIFAQIIDAVFRIDDLIEQRLALIRANQDAVCAHSVLGSSPGPFHPRFGRNFSDAVANADHVGLLELPSVHSSSAISFHGSKTAQAIASAGVASP